MPKTEKTVALDIGGVCIRLRYDLCFQALCLAETPLFPVPLLKICEEYECGRASSAEWMAEFRKIMNFRFTETELWNAWNAIIGDTMPGMEEQIKKYTGCGIKFVFLSDISETHLAECFRKCAFSHLVTDGIFSFEVGARKPSPDMFRAFEQKHGKPDLYFDDRVNNIEGAQKFGWNAVLFSSASQLDLIGAQE